MIIETMNDFTISYSDELCAKHDFIFANTHLIEDKYKLLKQIGTLFLKTKMLAMENEINSLLHKSEKIQLKLVFLKGIVLAKELYDYPECRPTTDIDILVLPEQLADVVKMCSEMGYTNMPDAPYDNTTKHFETTEHHYPPLVKTVFVGNKTIPIMLEIHTQVYVQALHQINVNREAVTVSAINRAVNSSAFGDQNILVLCAEDNFLFMAVHLVKHIFHEVLGVITYGHSPTFISFAQMMDLALFYDKYRKDICPNTMLARAVEWDVIPELMFVSELLKVIYPNLLEEIDIEKAYKLYDRRFGFYASSIRHLLSQNIKDVLFLSSHELASVLIAAPTNINAVLKCPFFQYGEGENGCIHFNMHTQRYHDKTYSKYVQGRCLETDSDLNCVCRSKWDEEKLYFSFTILDDELIFGGKNHLPDWTGDSVELHFLDYHRSEGQPFVQMICISPHEVHDSYDIRICDINKNEQEWNKDTFSFDFSAIEGGYRLELGIKWSKIGIEPNSNVLIPMNIIVNDVDNKPKPRARLSWMEEIPYLVDIFSMGVIQLR